MCFDHDGGNITFQCKTSKCKGLPDSKLLPLHFIALVHVCLELELNGHPSIYVKPNFPNTTPSWLVPPNLLLKLVNVHTTHHNAYHTKIGNVVAFIANICEIKDVSPSPLL